ncbi:MAG: hypothetical protein KJO43_07560 [Phycisphaerae bacterium]|nr:hypothetical protein [Phycisphaerae bacterium]
MKRENIIWIVLIAIGVLLVGGRVLMTGGVGKAYVRAVPAAVDDAHPDGRWTTYEQSSQRAYAEAMAADPTQTTYQLSLSRTFGIWVAALFTLFIFSFLIKDNPFYKIAEACVVGVSAAYWMVIGFWTTIVPNLIGKLSPDLVRSWALPGLGEEQRPELIYIVPTILGVMLLWRLSPKGGWISRWPMAFIIGVFCGLRLVTFIHADFLSQIRNGIVPLWVETGGSFDFWESLRNVFLIVGVLSSLVYFFFSIEHRGVVGKTARLGIWFLMVTFGAAFGYTVMGRIALLAIRIEFIFDDWLWLIDPTGKRELVAMILQPALSTIGLA